MDNLVNENIPYAHNYQSSNVDVYQSIAVVYICRSQTFRKHYIVLTNYIVFLELSCIDMKS